MSNKSQTVLCVGAGPEQVPSIIEAKKSGLSVVALDVNPLAPGLSLADYRFEIDIANEKAVISIAKQFSVLMTIPAPIGRYLTTIGAVNDALGLQGITRQSAVNCTDKMIFHKLLSVAGIERPRQTVVCENSSLLAEILHFGLPCILKPRFGSGSRGIIVIRSQDEVQSYLNMHLHSHLDKYDTLIEEFITGTVIGVDGVIINSTLTLVLMRKKVLTPLPYRVEIAYMAPAPFNDVVYEKVRDVISHSAKAIGLDNCLLHADLIIRENGLPIVIEMAGRPSGLSISSKMVPAATGINFLGNGIKMLLGEPYNFQTIEIHPVALFFLALSPGQVSEVPNNEIIHKFKGVIDFSCQIKVGDILHPIKSANDCLTRGFIMTTADTLEDACNTAENILHLFKVEH